jgi:hypothetical protein
MRRTPRRRAPTEWSRAIESCGEGIARFAVPRQPSFASRALWQASSRRSLTRRRGAPRRRGEDSLGRASARSRTLPLHPRPPQAFLVVAVKVLRASAILCASAWNHVAHGRVRVADPSIKNGGFNGIRADCRDARASTQNFCECATRDRRGGPPKAVVRASVSSALILSTLRSWCLLAIESASPSTTSRA